MESGEDAPQSTQDLTIFVRRRRPLHGCEICKTPGLTHVHVLCHAQVQNLLQQMQGRFATMSDAIIGRSAHAIHTHAMVSDFATTESHAFSFFPAVDEMGVRIDELENSIGELMAQAGIDEEPLAADGQPAGGQQQVAVAPSH